MPRWIGASLLTVFGVYGIFIGIWEGAFYMPPFGRLPTWVGRVYHILLGVACIVGAILIVFRGQ